MSSLFADLRGTVPWQPMTDALGASRVTPQVRCGIAKALRQFVNEKTYTVLEALLLKDSEPAVRCAAANSLGCMPAQKALESLSKALGDRSASVRAAAVDSLGCLGANEASKPISRAVSDVDPAVRCRAIIALGRLGNAGVEPLLLALKDSQWQIRNLSAQALGEIKSPLAIAPLSAAVADPHEEVRFSAADALAKIGGPATVEPLISSWRINDILVNTVARNALVAMGHECVERLVKALGDANVSVREQAAIALGQIGDPRAIPALQSLADRDPDSMVATAAIAALAKIRAK
jgi:HEAT repeat protein